MWNISVLCKQFTTTYTYIAANEAIFPITDEVFLKGIIEFPAERYQ
jgi:hypothetical protein